MATMVQRCANAHDWVRATKHRRKCPSWDERGPTAKAEACTCGKEETMRLLEDLLRAAAERVGQ